MRVVQDHLAPCTRVDSIGNHLKIEAVPRLHDAVKTSAHEVRDDEPCLDCPSTPQCIAHLHEQHEVLSRLDRVKKLHFLAAKVSRKLHMRLSVRVVFECGPLAFLEVDSLHTWFCGNHYGLLEIIRIWWLFAGIVTDPPCAATQSGSGRQLPASRA